MSNIDKQALRGQSVEGSFYLVECCNCGEMYPSNLLDGGEAIADSGDYGDCYCHLCGADDTERADWGDVNSNEAKAWNFQQKRIEALLDELESKDKSISFLKDQLAQLANFNPDWDKLEAATDSLREHMAELTAARKRIAELEALGRGVKQFSEFQICHYGATEDYAKGYIDCQNNYNKVLFAAAGKGEAS
ncbi:hypothetical protein I4B37_004236 [Enterobacter hormaechei]|nr:hypothetical protein [Enterobacter hormaechei]